LLLHYWEKMLENKYNRNYYIERLEYVSEDVRTL